MTQKMEYYCAHCGRKISVLAVRFLKGGQIVCSKCCKRIPIDMLLDLDRYDFKAFQNLRDYMENMETMHRNFRETAAYCGVRIDEIHGWFIVNAYNRNMVFRFADLARFQMNFVAEDTYDGAFRSMVIGRMAYSMQVDFPYVAVEGTLSSWVNATAKIERGMSKHTSICRSPVGMEAFMNRFQQAWNKARYENPYENVA